MRARVVVFPMKGRNWCFSRSIENPVNSESKSAHSNPSTLIDLCKTISSNPKPMAANAELVVDFVSNKPSFNSILKRLMNKAWIGLEKAPEGSFKNKIYGVGLWLLARVKPSEIFLQSISKDITRLEITYPTSLNARLVRRRLRHIAMRGSIIHKNYMYGSASLLPLTAALVVLPLPNIPFFWMLFRTYSHWRALQGSEKLLQLVSDGSATQNANTNTEHGNSRHGSTEISRPPWVLAPSKDLEELLCRGNAHDGLSECVVSDICKTFNLNSNDVFKYERSV